MNSYLKGYEEYRGGFPLRLTGSLVADRQGEAVSYALFNLEPQGSVFLTPGEPVDEGMIIGEHNRENYLNVNNVNPCKMKKLTNMRASNKDDSIQLTPVIPLTLEKAIEFIKDDEMVEVTPRSIRLRKAFLSAETRQRLRGGEVECVGF